MRITSTSEYIASHSPSDVLCNMCNMCNQLNRESVMQMIIGDGGNGINCKKRELLGDIALLEV